MTLAIEHTLIQPFVGEKFDTKVFMDAFGRIEKNPVLVVPERSLKVVVPVAAVPKGYIRGDVGEELLAWLTTNHGIALKEGYLQQTVTVCAASKLGPLSLVVGLKTMHLPGLAGSALISRGSMPKDLPAIVEKAPGRKLPKLVKAKADRRLLFFEQDQTALSDIRILKEVEKLAPAFPNLRKVDELWLIDTSIVATDGCANFALMDGRGLVEQMWFENGILRFRRDDRPVLGPARPIGA